MPQPGIYPGGPGKVGRSAQDNRRFIKPCSGSSAPAHPGTTCHNLPPDYGHWNTAHRRFGRWQEDRHRACLLAQLSDAPDREWLMVGASHIKVH